MGTISWSQDKFSYGELTPYMYGHIQTEARQFSLKTCKNTIVNAQSGVSKRFGTKFLASLRKSNVYSYKDYYMEDWSFSDGCDYVTVFTPGFIDIYLEGYLVKTITTSYNYKDLEEIDSTIYRNAMVITASSQQPYWIQRDFETSIAINSVASNVLTLNAAYTNAPVGSVLPVQFTYAVAPTATPAIITGYTYFIKLLTTTTVAVYSAIEDAANQENQITITAIGTTPFIGILNAFTYTALPIRADLFPQFDFGFADYSTVTFTPGAGFGTIGATITITASAAFNVNGVATGFTNQYINGSIQFNGGLARIISITSTTVVNAYVLDPFINADATIGTLVLLREKVWSTTATGVVGRGWPNRVGCYQNRLIFANTGLIENGLWLSAINNPWNFSDLFIDDDDAISYYPTTGNIDYINFIVAYRSLTIHSKQGIFSTPTAFEESLSPRNFCLLLQDTAPATSIYPVSIDNQIIVLSGNDARSLKWQGDNASYISDIASINSSHLINNPHDVDVFAKKEKSSMHYIFIVNEDGTIAMFNSLESQGISAFTRHELSQSYGDAYYRYSCATPGGRAWYLVERWLAEAQTPVAISAVSTTDVTVTGIDLAQYDYEVIAIVFAGAALPSASVTITTTQWYWAVAVDANTVNVYQTQSDANERLNPITFTTIGTTATITPYPPIRNFLLEEIDENIYTDGSTKYSGTATDTLTVNSLFNAQQFRAVGDGFSFTGEIFNGEMQLVEHGIDFPSTEIIGGFAIDSEVETLTPAAPSAAGYRGSAFAYPTHIRSAAIMFVESIGGSINGTEVAYKTLEQQGNGDPPSPQSKMVNSSIMKGWEFTFGGGVVFTHSEPYNFNIGGIFYKLEL